jgi:hypothetical protein
LPEIRFHDLRHTAASLMLNNGIPVIVVSRRLGHARPSITLDVYGYLIPSKQQEAAEKMDELLTPISVEFTNSPQSGHLAVSKVLLTVFLGSQIPLPEFLPHPFCASSKYPP